MIQLRPYQIEMLNTIHNDLKSDSEILIQAITGAGKTVVLCRLINKYYFDSKKRFLILVHKQELVEQFNRTFRDMTDIPSHAIGLFCAGICRKEISRITIATVQSFIGKMNDYDGCELMIIDEAHRISIGTNSQYDQVVESLRLKNPSMRIIGCTSTPYRLGHGYIYGDMAIGKNLFPKLNLQVKYKDLLAQGYLMRIEGKVSVHSQLSDDLSKVGVSGDYVLDQLGDVMQKEIHLKTAADAIRKYCNEYKHICVFCCTISHAKKVQELLADECTIVHSNLTDIERHINMEDWKSGRKRIITSVNILVEGFDFPPLDCLVMARPTLSSGLYLQAIGRILRPSVGKEKAFMLDLTDNTSRFGTDLDNVKVSIPKSVEEKIKKKQLYEKLCPECEIVMHSARAECPECGYEFPGIEIHEAQILPELSDVVFGKPMRTEHEVYSMSVFAHRKKGKIPSLRVNYYSDRYGLNRIASEWVCLEHQGYPRRKAEEWWEKFTTEHDCPDTVDDALSKKNLLCTPDIIITEPDGKFIRIVDHLFSEIPF